MEKVKKLLTIFLERVLCNDDSIDLIPEQFWPKWIDYHYLELCLQELTDEDFDYYVTGTSKESEAVVEKYNLYHLDNFFDEIVFGDIYHYYFYEKGEFDEYIPGDDRNDSQ